MAGYSVVEAEKLSRYRLEFYLAKVQKARRFSGRVWRMSLAVAANESDFGRSDLARNHNNLHGHKAFPDLYPHHKPADDGVHRHFDDRGQTWKSFFYLVAVSKNNPDVREAIGKLFVQRKSLWTIEAVAIGKLEDPYCEGDPEWDGKVKEYLGDIWRLFPEEEE